MADSANNAEQISEEDAQRFLQEDFDKISGKTPTPVEELEPASENKEEGQGSEDTTPEDSTSAEESETPKEEAQPQTPAADPYAWVDGITDEDLKTKIVAEIGARHQADHRVRSDQGRVAAFQRQAQELKNELARLKEAQTKPSEEGPQTPPTNPEEWRELMESDPALGKAMQAMMKAELENERKRNQDQFKEQLKGELRPFQEAQQQQMRDAETQKLLVAVPNAFEVIASEPYQYYINNVASPGLRYLANQSTNHTDAVDVLQNYAFWLQSQQQSRQPPAQVVQQPVDTSAADRIQKDRDAKLAVSTPVGAASSPIRTGASPLNMEEEQANALLLKYYADIKAGKLVTK